MAFSIPKNQKCNLSYLAIIWRRERVALTLDRRTRSLRNDNIITMKAFFLSFSGSPPSVLARSGGGCPHDSLMWQIGTAETGKNVAHGVVNGTCPLESIRSPDRSK